MDARILLINGQISVENLALVISSISSDKPRNVCIGDSFSGKVAIIDNNINVKQLCFFFLSANIKKRRHYTMVVLLCWVYPVLELVLPTIQSKILWADFVTIKAVKEVTTAHH